VDAWPGGGEGCALQPPGQEMGPLQSPKAVKLVEMCDIKDEHEVKTKREA
jgi:hypothetical protein